jgi:hypothetical protein
MSLASVEVKNGWSYTPFPNTPAWFGAYYYYYYYYYIHVPLHP